MGVEVVDKLIFALDGDLTALKAKYAEAEADAGRTGGRIADNFQKPIKEAAASAAIHARALGTALGGASAGAEKLGRAVELSRREVTSLGIEIASGNFSRAPISIARIATELLGLSSSAILVGVAIAAIPVALVSSIFSAENALERVRIKLEATGFAAGATRDDILGIAQALDRTSNLSTRGALDMAGILAGRGNVRLAQLPGATVAAGLFGKATGLGEDKAATEFEKVLADASQGVDQLNAEFKLFDPVTTRLIKSLEASGNSQAAQQLIIDAVNNRLKNLEDGAWSLSQVFDGVGKVLSDFWFKTGSLFTLTDQQRLDRMRNPIVTPEGQVVGGGSPAEIQALQNKINHDTLMARGAEIAQDAKTAIDSGLKIADSYDKQADNARKLDAELLQLNKALQGASAYAPGAAAELLKIRDAVMNAAAAQRTPAQIAAQQAANEIAVARAAPADRDALRRRLEIEEQFRQNQANPAMLGEGDAIRRSQLATINPLEERAGRDRIATLTAETAGQQEIARAYAVSTAAGERARIADQVHQDVIKGTIRSNQQLAVTEAELSADAAKRATATAARNTAANEEIRGQQNIAAAFKVSTAAGKEAEIVDEARRAHLNDDSVNEAQYAQQLRDRAKAQRDVGGAEEVQNLERRVAMTRTELAVIGQTDVERARQLSLQETINSLEAEGIPAGTAEWQDRLAAMQKNNEQLINLEEKLREAQRAERGMQEVSREAGSILNSALDGAIKGTFNLKDMLLQLLSVIDRLALTNPFENWLTGQMTGRSGTLPTLDSIFGALGGGGSTGGAGFLGTISGAGLPEGVGDVTITPAVAGVFHDGGLVGSSSVGTRSISAAAFAGARRYHSGLMPDEMAAILQKGEIVIPRRLTAPIIGAATGSSGYTDSGSYEQGRGSNSMNWRGGDTYHNWNINGAVDANSIVRSRSQIAAYTTRSNIQGQRNT